MSIAFAHESCRPAVALPVAANYPAPGHGLPVALLGVAPASVLQIRQALGRMVAVHKHAAGGPLQHQT